MICELLYIGCLTPLKVNKLILVCWIKYLLKKNNFGTHSPRKNTLLKNTTIHQLPDQISYHGDTLRRSSEIKSVPPNLLILLMLVLT